MIQAWPLLALAFSFWGAVIIGYNQWAQVAGHKLVVLRVLGVWPAAALSLLFFPWPHDWRFYVAAAAMGMGLSYGDLILFNASAKHGARLAALYVPMKMLIGFALWAVVMPETLLPVVMVPWRIALLTLGFGLCSGALMFIRRSDGSVAALLAVLPVAMLYALADVVSKDVLGPVTAVNGLAPVVGSAVAFLSTTSLVGLLGGLLLEGKFTPTRSELLRSAGFGVIFITGLVWLLVTLALAPNPGYVASITMLCALWLAFYGWVQRRERNNWWAGLTLLGGAVCVAIATAVV